jgi:cyclic pyranopterin phosphate synthase
MTANLPLIDPFDRRIDYLRLSVTDRCDFRCTYCMDDSVRFLPRSEVLSADQIVRLADVFVQQGIRKIRLTGGEPLLRSDLPEIASRLTALAGLNHLALTTNGSRLASQAARLRDCGIDSINISLDSLRAERFRALTRSGVLQDVLAGIDAAVAAGFTRVRINSVILRGRNDDEVLDLVAFACSRGVDIAFIEEMPLGHMQDRDRASNFCASDTLRSMIGAHYTLTACAEPTKDPRGPARYYRIAGAVSKMGFIEPHSNNFCSSCNRLRVTANGRLLLCLGNEAGVDLQPGLRQTSDTWLHETLRYTLRSKPERHHFVLDEPPQILRFMNATGG